MTSMQREPFEQPTAASTQRRALIKALSLAPIGMTAVATLRRAAAALEPRSRKTPALFVGHGSPMNAVVDNVWSRRWAEIGAQLESPSAILCVSAHWETRGAQVTAMDRPRTIHDFSGFPDELSGKRYPAPGSPALARQTAELVRSAPVGLDQAWGLDHGSWSVLARMFPRADIPVVQLSLDTTRSPEAHYELGRELKALRQRGVLVLGSGNIVHNLRRADRRLAHSGFDWAIEFDARVKKLIEAGDHRALMQYDQLGRAAQLSVPTSEHFLPLLYALAVKDEAEPIAYFNAAATMGSISMRSLLIG
jgi:4,5-DOPA dioxygenase extradiol